MSSDRPKIPVSETRDATPLTQEIKLPNDRFFLLGLRKPISWYDNFIASCHIDESEASSPLTLFIYDCTELSKSGTLGGPLKFSLQPYSFGAVCPLPVDLEKPKKESFVLIGTKDEYESKELSLNCRVFEKEENEFKFSEHSFTVKCPRKAIDLQHSYAFVMPKTQILGFICGKVGFLIDIENKKLLAQFDLPKHMISSTFVEPHYLVVNDAKTRQVTAWQITREGLKPRGYTNTKYDPISSWAWRGGNFLAVAEYKSGDQEGLITGYKIDRNPDDSLSFHHFGMARGEDLYQGEPKIIRDKLFFKKRPDRGTFKTILVAYDPDEGVTRPVSDYSDHSGNFFSTCAGIIACSEHGQSASLIAFSSPLKDPPIRTFIQDEEIPNALAQTPVVAAMPSGVLKIIASYASTAAVLFNSMRKSMQNEKALMSVLKNYVQNAEKNSNENKGETKSSGVTLGVKKLIKLLEEEKNFSRAQCVANVLAEFNDLKNLVEATSFARLRMSKENKDLISAIEQLRWTDDPSSRPWYR